MNYFLKKKIKNLKIIIMVNQKKIKLMIKHLMKLWFKILYMKLLMILNQKQKLKLIIKLLLIYKNYFLENHQKVSF